MNFSLKRFLAFSCLASLLVLDGTEGRAQSPSRVGVAPMSGDVPAGYAAKMPGRYIVGGRPEEPAPAPVFAPPSPAPEPVFEPGCKCEVVQLTRRVPPNGTVGQTLENDLILTAIKDACDIKLTYYAPVDATVLRTDPPAVQQGRKYVWMFDSMARGEVQNIKVWLKTETEGPLMTCACLSAVPKVCLTTMIGKATLAVEKTGPATAKLGDRLTYNLVVRNTGSSAAEDVVLTDTVPQGMSHESGQRVLSYNLGTLAPGESKQGIINLIVNERGRLCNTVTARASNAGTVSATACTTVVEQKLAVLKFGPREQFLGKNADYQVVVQNPGDTTLTGVTVTDTAPPETTMVSATGATVSGNQAVWRLAELKPGERQTFSVTLRATQGGTFCNRVSATTSEGLTSSAEACTLWRGLPAMLLEMVDDPDPIQIGELTTYTIRITNQGFANDGNVGMTVNFPPQITPVSAAGATAGVILGKSVRFDPYITLGPKQVIVWIIKAKGVGVGDGRVKAELTSDLLRTPVVKEESTQVY